MSGDISMPDVSEEGTAGQQRQYQATGRGRSLLNRNQNQQQLRNARSQIAAGIRGDARFPGETAGETSAAGAASGATAIAMGTANSRRQKRVQFDLAAIDPRNPIDADGDIGMADDDDAASIASGGSIPEGDPRKMLDLQPKRSRETMLEYRHRIKEAKQKLNIQSKPGFGFFIEAKEALQYERERKEEEHAMKINPESDAFDRDYAAEWRRQKQVRQEHNRTVKKKLLSDMREWEALSSHNAPRLKTPEPDPDSGDELYDQTLERDPVQGLFETMTTTFVPENNSSGWKGKGVGGPPGGFGGKVGSGGGGGREGEWGQGKGVDRGNGGQETGPPERVRGKQLPRCKACHRGKRRCSLQDHDERPCKECKRLSRVCEYGTPIKKARYKDPRYINQARRGQPTPTPRVEALDYQGYQGNPFQPSAAAGPSSRQILPRPAIDHALIDPALYAAQDTGPDTPAHLNPRASPPGRGRTRGLGSSRSPETQQPLPASNPYRDRRDGVPTRSRSRSPPPYPARQVSDCINCVELGKPCDRWTPCSECVREGRERTCGTAGDWNAPKPFARTYSTSPRPRNNPFSGNAQLPPIGQHPQQSTSVGYSGTPPPPSQASSMEMMGMMGMIGNFRGNLRGDFTESPPHQPPPPGPTFQNTGIYQHATVNLSNLQLPPGQKDIPYDQGSLGRQIEQAHVPQQEMQNASGTWGLDNHHAPPQAPSSLIGEPVDELVNNLVFDIEQLEQFLGIPAGNMGMDDMDPNADFTYPQLGATQALPIQAPAAPQTLPVPIDFSATRVRWRRRTEMSSLAYVNPLELFPSNPTGDQMGPGDNLNRCSELVLTGDDSLKLCNTLSARRCEYGIGRPLNSKSTHGKDAYYVCQTCRNEGQRLARTKKGNARSMRKLYTCATCARGIVAARGTGIDDCDCLERVRTAWVCKDDIQKGYDAIANQSARVSNFLQREWQGEPCPKCFVKSPDIYSGVFACKSCWHFVQEEQGS